MKNLINVITFAIIVIVFIAACSWQSKTDNAMQEQPTVEDSAIVTAPEIIRGRIIEDTIIGHWTIKTTKDSNDVVVAGSGGWSPRDSSVFLTLSYDNKIVCSNKEIRTKDIVGSEGEYMTGGGEVFWTSDSSIYLSFGSYKPDTDVGLDMLYQILPNGESNFSVLDYEMGVDGNNYIVNFMTLYLNERACGASAADLKRLYEHFCTKELAEELSVAAITIVSDDTDFRHADRTLQINNLDDLNGLPLEKYSFELKFKPNPKDDNVTDILQMEVDWATKKISRIESDERQMM